MQALAASSSKKNTIWVEGNYKNSRSHITAHYLKVVVFRIYVSMLYISVLSRTGDAHGIYSRY